MKNKTPLYLGGILLVLVIIFLATSINPPEKSKGAEPLFPGEKPDIDKLEIWNKRNGKIVVEEQNGVWNITEPVTYRASETSVETTINTLKNLLVDGVISDRQEAWEKFEVGDSLGTSLKVYSNGDLILDAIVGKHSVDLNHTYARLAGEDEIYLWRGMLKSHVDREPNDWRDKTIYSFNADDVVKITSASGETRKELTLADSLWVYTENGTEKPVDQKNVKDLVSLIATLKCDSFADEKDIPRVAENEPDTRVSFTVRNGDVHTFDVWTPGEQDAGRYLIRKENGDEVFRFYRYRGAQLVIDYERLKPDEAGG